MTAKTLAKKVNAIDVTKCPDHKQKVTVKLSDCKGDMLLFYGMLFQKCRDVVLEGVSVTKKNGSEGFFCVIIPSPVLNDRIIYDGTDMLKRFPYNI